MKKWKVTLTVEMECALTTAGGPVTIWCAQCRRMVWAVTPNALAVAAGISLQWLKREIEEHRRHFVGVGKGLPRVCLSSAEELEWEENHHAYRCRSYDAKLSRIRLLVDS